MKMNLSVVMGIVDKTTAPLKGMSSESDHYAKAIKKIQKAQADDSAALGMIDSFKSTQTASDKNALAIAAASEELEKLRSQAKAASQPSAALTEQLENQKDKLKALNKTSDDNSEAMAKATKELKRLQAESANTATPSKKLTDSKGNQLDSIKVSNFFKGKDGRILRPIYGELVRNRHGRYWMEL